MDPALKAAPSENSQQQLPQSWKEQRELGTADVSRAGWLGDTAALGLAIAQGTDLQSADANGTTPIGFVCGYGRHPALRLLLTSCVDPDAVCASNGERPVHRSARFGHRECLDVLIEAGACLAAQDDKGWTAVQHAAGRGHCMALATLCAALPPLHAPQLLAIGLRNAAQYGRCDCARVLLSYAAEVNSCDSKSGRSALAIAAGWGHGPIVALLLDANADPELRDAQGMSALDAAASRGYTRCIDILQNAPHSHPEPACVRICVLKATQLSRRLAILDTQQMDTNQQLSLIFDSNTTIDGQTSQPVDIQALVDSCQLPKGAKASTGLYIEAQVLIELSGVRVLQVISQSVEAHAHWQARVSRHGSDSARFAAFAQFIVDQLQLREGCTVLDVAGGQGRMAVELVRLGVQQVVLVDPAAHAGAAATEQIALGTIRVIQEPLDDAFIVKHQQLIASCGAVVALHPDEATDAAVHLGLKMKVPLAVVPCCVFPKLFRRKRQSGQGVVSCNGLVEYLIELQPTVMRSQILPFEGANRVVYSVLP